MSYQFYPLTVDYLHKETEDSVIIGFNTNGAANFKFVAGQNITIKLLHEGEELRRTYSICTSPSEGKLQIGVRAIKDGIFSHFALNKLKVGDVLEVMPPIGNFVVNNKEAASGQFVFFATGSGITPVISMIKEKLESDPNAQCLLFYSNKNIGSMMFRDELDGLKNKNLTRFQVVNIFSREQLDNELFYGRMSSQKCNSLIDQFINEPKLAQYFICGPEDLTLVIKDLLLQTYGIPAPQVHFELFHTGAVKVIEQATVSTTGLAKVTVRLDGKETTFDLAYDKQSILDAGIKNGLDLPYACKGGVCSTCKAHLGRGKVHMDLNYSLEEDELQDGFILTCQSHPREDELFVDYDY